MARLAYLVVVLALLAQVAPASDGVLEVNQACATSAAGCCPGDAGCFPITISQAGSYRLTSSLDVPASTTGIQIDAPNVNLDLSGFEVRGPNTCTGYPPTNCGVVTGASGIRGGFGTHFYVNVRN